MKKLNLILILIPLISIACKGDKGDSGSTGPMGSSLFSDKIQRSGAVDSDSIFVSVPNLSMENSFITVNVQDAGGNWVEIPFFSATIANNVAYTANSTGITILNAFSSGMTSYSILVVQ